jgi:hypothetical protein
MRIRKWPDGHRGRHPKFNGTWHNLVLDGVVVARIKVVGNEIIVRARPWSPSPDLGVVQQQSAAAALDDIAQR